MENILGVSLWLPALAAMVYMFMNAETAFWVHSHPVNSERWQIQKCYPHKYTHKKGLMAVKLSSRNTTLEQSFIFCCPYQLAAVLNYKVILVTQALKNIYFFVILTQERVHGGPRLALHPPVHSGG
jgi:hypothetical protein